jgi:PleD family two-component response regulator
VPEEKSTILVVEDDVDVADMLNAYFRVQGYEVTTAHWGEEAVRVSLSSQPDLVILDIRLPDIDGYEVARRLRDNRRTADIPIIFLTEKRDRADRLQGLQLGADDYITKPFDIQELRLRVRNALRRSTMSTLTNPVTGLAEGVLVDERLSECLDDRDWVLLLIVLENLDNFRESYGFVASDDVQRAVSLMIHNALRGVGGPNDFLGHLSPTEFVLVTSPGNVSALIERIRTRLDQSLDYFYPLKDRDQEGRIDKRLSVWMSQLSAQDGPFSDLEQIKAELMKRRI